MKSAFWRNGLAYSMLLTLTIASFRHVERVRAERRDGLIAAAERGDVGDASRLLARGNNPDVRRNGDNDTPLLLAARAGHLAVVTRLVDAGAAVSQTHDAMGSPLQTAVVNGRAGVVGFLLKRGASPHERNRHGDPVLALAAARGTPTVVRLLLQAGADPHARNPDGWTPLMYAWGDDTAAARVLVEYGARGEHRRVDAKSMRAE